jgi:hypothetical protein
LVRSFVRQGIAGEVFPMVYQAQLHGKLRASGPDPVIASGKEN